MINPDAYNHAAALIACSTLFDREPYSVVGDALTEIADKVATGRCRRYELTIPVEQAQKYDTLLHLIEGFATDVIRFSIWSGLGYSLQDKLVSRRNIKYYKLNLVERIGLADPDPRMTDDNGWEIESMVEALFPEISIERSGENLQLNFHLPDRY